MQTFSVLKAQPFNDATSFQVAERRRTGNPWAPLCRIPLAIAQHKILDLSSDSDLVYTILSRHVRTFNRTKLSESQSFKSPGREQGQDANSYDGTEHRMCGNEAFHG